LSTIHKFPSYSLAERAADAAVHAVGVPLGLVAALALVGRATAFGALTTGVIGIYAVGLIGMLCASAAYQLCPHGLLKERLRRIDRAMIFVMIAGTYTPTSVLVLYGGGGLALCLLLWSLAAFGIFLTFRYPYRFERALLGLYLVMGWMLLTVFPECVDRLHGSVLALLLAGGIVYTGGAVLQAMAIKFHNPIWHLLILIAAAMQYAATSLQLTGGIF
jgi:hemolysin III